MGRTIPSFRIALGIEKDEWKLFRNALDKSERKRSFFDDEIGYRVYFLSNFLLKAIASKPKVRAPPTILIM
jgi:hypothetical protein